MTSDDAGEQQVVREHRGLHARAAHLVDRGAAGGERQAGAERRLARRRLALAGRQHAAHDHFLHVLGLDLRRARPRRGSRRRRARARRSLSARPGSAPIGVRAAADDDDRIVLHGNSLAGSGRHRRRAPGLRPRSTISAGNGQDLRVCESMCTPVSTQIAETSPVTALRISCTNFASFSRTSRNAERIDDGVAGEQLALVGDVLLHRRHAAAVLLQERGGDAERGEQIPGRLVELADVPHDVHVAHVVAVPGIDRAAVGLDQVASCRSRLRYLAGRCSSPSFRS